ncbi:MAG: CRISPR-associated protein Cas4 [Candidatus Sumerlaeia bacterium]|nr:CRISPR-associated protein Cas4 [Candidatus Sumerlaeia bacterium]
MYEETDLLPLSGLAQLAYCERRAALIHLEQQWEENRFTAEGRVLHDRADEPETESRGDLRVARALRLRSLRLGLSGVADVVEFHRVESGGVALDDCEGLWQPFPVEYKRGKPKPINCDRVQLCAQAMCLEEMLGAAIPRGALFYARPRRRQEVEFDEALRGETEHLAERLHALIASGVTPPPVPIPACEFCSLFSRCMPDALSRTRRVGAYISHAIREASDDVA